jgi:hypothetical protein
MTDKEVMKLALDALELSKISVDNFCVQKATQEAIAALKARLAQPEQEHPVYSPFISCELWRLRK